MEGLLPAFGVLVDPSALTVPRAKSLAGHLLAGRSQYARLVAAAKATTGVETVVVDLDAEVPQAPVHAIAPVERVAIQLYEADRFVPDVLALRPDFPQVPHLHLRVEEYPKSLCLYEQPWPELKLRTTPAAFIDRIREWLSLTARGELHGDDQPLEPILLGWEHHLVLPADTFQADASGEPVRLYVELVNGGPDTGVLVARRVGHPRAARDGLKFVATTMRCEPQEHGVIRRAPATLEDLHDLVAAAGLDLKAELRKTMVAWRGHSDLHQARPILIIWFPKTRNAESPAESSDIWAFALHEPISRLAGLLNAWQLDGKHAVPLIGNAAVPAGAGKAVGVSLLNPMWTLTGARAAAMNGLAPDARLMVAVGAGALGSQVVLNLVRAGFGQWTTIDRDRLFPHNLARHELNGFAIGMPKATALAGIAHSIRETEPRPTALVADVLSPGDHKEALDNALSAAACILDLSASVPVARLLARRAPAGPRRVSAFLNPPGRDLVLLAEDEGRRSKLDHLEHQLYRELLTNPDLADHLKRDLSRHRYAQSCRDVSSTLPQHLASLHAAITSCAFRDAIAKPGATIRLWRAAPDMTVTSVVVAAEPTIEHEVGGWTVCSDPRFFNRIAELRRAKLPNETGGVLLGSFDLERKIIYLVDTVPSPPDSKEWPTLYIRGSEGLAAEVRRVSETTGGMLQYVGEWHSHPRGVPPLPSSDDCTVFAWLTDLMDRDGFPAVMMIAADRENIVFVGRMVRGKEPW